MKRKPLFPVLLLTIACLVWSTEFILMELVLKDIPSSFFTMLRLAAATLGMWIFYWITNRHQTIESKDRLTVIMTGVWGVGIYFYLENMGVEHTSGALASMILAIIPIFGLLADRIFFKHKITTKKAIAAVISIVGVLLIILGGGDSGFSGSIGGCLFMLAAAILWTGYLIYSKPLLEKYSVSTVVSRQFFVAFLISIPLAFADPPDTSAVTPRILLLSLLVGSCTAIAEIVYVYALSLVSVSYATLAENFIPVCTVFLGFLVFRTLPGHLQLVGGIIVIIAVLIASDIFSKGKAEEAEPVPPPKLRRAAGVSSKKKKKR